MLLFCCSSLATAKRTRGITPGSSRQVYLLAAFSAGLLSFSRGVEEGMKGRRNGRTLFNWDTIYAMQTTLNSPKCLVTRAQNNWAASKHSECFKSFMWVNTERCPISCEVI